MNVEFKLLEFAVAPCDIHSSVNFTSSAWNKSYSCLRWNLRLCNYRVACDVTTLSSLLLLQLLQRKCE